MSRLRTAAEQLHATDPNVSAVVLFGSLADGTATPRCDADLLVLLQRDARRMVDRIPQYARAFEDVGLGVQVIPWTLAELDRRRRERDSFAADIMARAVTLAGALPAGSATT